MIQSRFQTLFCGCAIAAALALAVTAHAQSADVAASARLGLIAMEHVNAVESDVKQRTGRYAAWADLVQLPQFLTSAPEELRSRLTKDPEQTIPGYVAHVETTNYGDGYIALLVDRDSGYALRSDDSGVVAIGSSLDPSTKKPSPAFVHFSRTAFAPPSK